MNTLTHKVIPFGMGGGRRMTSLTFTATTTMAQSRSTRLNTSMCLLGTNWKLFGTLSSPSSCNCGTTPTPQGKAAKTTKRTMTMRKSFQPLSWSQMAGIASSPSTWSRMSSSASSQAQLSHASSEAKVKGLQWDLVAGVVVERRPIITKKKDDVQQRYMDMVSKLEFELSKKSDHELRRENDAKMLEKVKSGEIDLGNVQTARDDEDKWATEIQSFELGKRETDADLKKDTKSLERALDSHLLLVVEQKLGKEYRWICPQSKLQQGETLRQAAERMIRDTFPDMKAKILGNAPWGFYKYKYPKSEVTDGTPVGAKVFFYKAQVVSGEPKINSGSAVKDFVWLKRDELPSKLQEEYYKKLSECIIDE